MQMCTGMAYAIVLRMGVVVTVTVADEAALILVVVVDEGGQGARARVRGLNVLHASATLHRVRQCASRRRPVLMGGNDLRFTLDCNYSIIARTHRRGQWRLGSEGSAHRTPPATLEPTMRVGGSHRACHNRALTGCSRQRAFAAHYSPNSPGKRAEWAT